MPLAYASENTWACGCLARAIHPTKRLSCASGTPGCAVVLHERHSWACGFLPRTTHQGASLASASETQALRTASCNFPSVCQKLNCQKLNNLSGGPWQPYQLPHPKNALPLVFKKHDLKIFEMLVELFNVLRNIFLFHVATANFLSNFCYKIKLI